MARPKVPLISKRVTLETALKIIDREGLEELSMRRLARELDINGASLYHHFRNKDEILLGAALLALGDARLPGIEVADWREWFIDQARLYRRALLKHPALVTVILKQHPHRIALNFYDAAVSILLDNGVPSSSIIPLLESMESFTIGSVLYSIAAKADANNLGKAHKALGQARRTAASHVSDEELWETVARAITDAILGPAKPAKRTPARRVQPPNRHGAKAS